jgi:cystathionine beta-lyase/cystathionine gamma-synthase
MSQAGDRYAEAAPRLATPPPDDLAPETAALHDALDAQAAATGSPWLHPSEPTVQLDLLCGDRVAAWQEAKAAALLAGESCWSELPPLYARYGTALLAPGAHVVIGRQTYNKSRTYARWLTERLGGGVSLFDDGDLDGLDAAIRDETRVVFVETFTNPRMRAQDIPALVERVGAARARAPGIRLVVDSTIATPWGFRTPLLAQGVDVVVASGTKALGGSDRDLWGYVATDDIATANAVMDLLAMRGGILDARRAAVVLDGLGVAESRHQRRCESAARVAASLAAHPRVEEVFHPSLSNHPDREVVARDYLRTGSVLSFRVSGADETATRHVADVIAMTRVFRYALSFDGLVSKVNHHQTVSEYFTPEPVLRRLGLDRLIRLGIGLEATDDLTRALDWALAEAPGISPGDVAAWVAHREGAWLRR